MCQLIDIKYGTNRLVILIYKYAVKIANPIYGHKHFLIGCLANWNERERYLLIKRYSKDSYLKIAISLWCSYFGLIQIQKRCKELDRELTDEEYISFEYYCNNDCKRTNFGYYHNNIVCLDYP